jgi:hypothetical protein
MTLKDRSTSASRRVVVSTALFAAAAALAPAGASAQSTIKRVSLLVKVGGQDRPIAGKLFKVLPDGRKGVAEVATDGTPSENVTCTAGQLFEAETNRLLDTPAAPERVACAETMSFAFKRTWQVLGDIDGGNPYKDFFAAKQDAGGAAKLYLVLGDAVKYKADAAAAMTWDDAAKLSAASKLGDKDYDEYVYRDATRGYSVAWTKKGIDALKSVQKDSGLKQTGQLDKNTADAIARLHGTTPELVKVPRLFCEKKAATFNCSEAVPPAPAFGVIIPQVLVN